jgi:DNA-binding transcriptional MerR regulator
METTVLSPKKTYYSISEVCTMTTLEPHVLRYWESEFPQLRPKKKRAGNRAYRDKDIDTIEYIKRLLYDEKYTIPGARKKLSEIKENGEALPIQETLPLIEPALLPQPVAAPESVSADPAIAKEIITELKDVLKILKG